MSDPSAPAQTPDKAPELIGELPSSELEEFLENHGKKTVAIILLVVAAAGIYFFAKTKAEAAQREANEAFVSAITRADLEAVADKYAGTVAGGNALLALANAQLDIKKPQEAHATLTKFISNHAEDPLYYNGVFALACVDEELGNADAALAGFQKVAGAGNEAIAGAAAALRVADLLLAKGELEEAKKGYESIGASFPGSPFIAEAEARVLLAEQKITLRDHPAPAPEKEPEPEPEPEPEVAPTPAPSAAQQAVQEAIEEAAAPAPDPDAPAPE